MTALIILIFVLFGVLLFSAVSVGKEAYEREEELFTAYKQNNIPGEVWELAKLMQVKTPVNAPDWLSLLIGEVIANRVDSVRFPDSFIDVIHDKRPVQFECVFQPGWDDVIPDDDFIDLAERVVNGERALGDSDMLFFGNVPEGTGTLVSYYDTATKTMIYFCKG